MKVYSQGNKSYYISIDGQRIYFSSGIHYEGEITPKIMRIILNLMSNNPDIRIETQYDEITQMPRDIQCAIQSYISDGNIIITSQSSGSGSVGRGDTGGLLSGIGGRLGG